MAMVWIEAKGREISQKAIATEIVQIRGGKGLEQKNSRDEERTDDENADFTVLKH